MYNEIASNKRKTWLFVLLFVIVLLVFGTIIGYLSAGDAITGFILATFFTVPSAVIGYYASDKIALAVNGAKEISKEQAPELFRLVENLTIATGLPMPRLYIIEDDAMNAFATGRDPKHAALAFTTGILRRLEKVELEGVVAHELSHVKNYDIRLGTIVVVCVGIITMFADIIWRFNFFRRSRRSGDGAQLALILLIVGIALSILAPIGAKLIQLALSRQREYLADASGALMTRFPDGLARALEKISQDTDPLDHMNKATSHLYIADPTHADLGDGQRRAGSWIQRLFSTHPPIQDRIARLRTMGK